MVFGGETPESYYDEGVTAAMKGDLTGAIQCFEHALELDRSHVGAYHQLGKCYVRLGQPQKAIQYLEHAIRARPNQVPPRLDLGFALLDAGEILRARSIFEEVAQVKVDSHRAQLGFAFCAFHEGNWEGAAALAQSTLAMGGSGFAVQYLLGRAARLAKQDLVANEALDAADAIMKQSIETSPDQPEAYYLRGCIHATKDKFPEAIQFFREAESRTKPAQHYSAYSEHFTHTDVLARLGLCLQRLGQKAAAREIGQRLLKEDPEHKTGKLLTKE